MKKTYKNLVAIHSKVIPPALCKKTIKFFKDNQKVSFNSGLAALSGTEGVINKEMRKSKEINLFFNDPKTKDLCEELCNKIKPIVNDYWNKFSPLFSGVRETIYEDAHLLRYEPNTGFYNFHYDSDGGDISGRLISIIIYLNDVKEGGETEFAFLDVDPIKPVLGDVVLFPSGEAHIHRGNIPISNSKYICVFWLRRNNKDLIS